MRLLFVTRRLRPPHPYEESTSTTNYRSGSGTCRMGAVVNHSFSDWKVILATDIQANGLLTLVRLVSGW